MAARAGKAIGVAAVADFVDRRGALAVRIAVVDAGDCVGRGDRGRRAVALQAELFSESGSGKECAVIASRGYKTA